MAGYLSQVSATGYTKQIKIVLSLIMSSVLHHDYHLATTVFIII